jgi:phospholipase C
MKRVLGAKSPILNGALAALTFTSMNVVPVWSAIADQQNHGQQGTRTPIEHVIMIIGENRTFDHVFATYTPQSGQTVNRARTTPRRRRTRRR